LLFKKGIPERESLDMNEVIQEMIVLLYGEATRYAISIETDLSALLPRVMADRVQLQQVFMNLMLNGIEAMKEIETGRELTISSEHSESDGHVLVTVSDKGPGLPPERADQIFDAFFTTKPEGTGMGLAISRSIIESHDGSMWVSGDAPRGASFHFTLPALVEEPK
jgi:signal transduction histidine kinase